jgi:hypothetical protein
LGVFINNSNFILSDFKSVYNDSIVLNLNPTQFSGLVDINFKDIELNTFSFLSLDDMISLSEAKNNVDELVKIFPSLADEIELLDL